MTSRPSRSVPPPLDTRCSNLDLQLVEFLKAKQAEHPLPEVELVGCIWVGFTSSIDWNARPDQIEGLALREVTVGLASADFNSIRELTLYGRNMRPFWNRFVMAPRPKLPS